MTLELLGRYPSKKRVINLTYLNNSMQAKNACLSDFYQNGSILFFNNKNNKYFWHVQNVTPVQGHLYSALFLAALLNTPS